MTVIKVPGGVICKYNLFKNIIDSPLTEFGKGFAMAALDPPYSNIVKQGWDRIDAYELPGLLRRLFDELAELALPGAHAWLWGAVGKPKQRAFYKTVIGIEEDGKWQGAEQITWEKKRAYGTDWQCLLNREECFRFVLGDIKKPRVYNVQYSDRVRPYKGFNKKYPAKSEYYRLTQIWNHASDMGQNKPHQCHKPKPLCVSQIAATTNPGDLVLDLFSGSGEMSVVAREMDRPFVAYEFDDKEFDKLYERLK